MSAELIAIISVGAGLLVGLGGLGGLMINLQSRTDKRLDRIEGWIDRRLGRIEGCLFHNPNATVPASVGD